MDNDGQRLKMAFLYVAIGGAIGAVARYAISLLPIKSEFPILTLITNVLGAILIGFIVGFFEGKENTSPNTLLFLKTGVCGGFTTFSTFSLEAYNLFYDKSYVLGTIYAILSVVLCVIGIFFGKRISMLIK